ncbi:cytochrome d ubiquinol oxidase subunit II [Mycolicibacterium sp. BK556]|uniref:cytochrome d ubiquinol oxidase subunit II n=1 Tax=Mycobacteriaceae TaxID=1762 RepID=UPI00105D9037|nr:MULTISPECIES: cytochrome d ubiquinol oxidase subunit II [Mycobacteriaceae]MBB3606815.1 cytochrome d ubiquinol oxidase subunit II [Mycolicibacterium sp. BK556]MBB3636519.1 cytochrome d ubiquinol oxidase subunit II [Mycolicibacterium sp. BK607]MBB3754394.1 cytochrome d ubiquinol oxidase subunit II [Mycolicibacterium sp. BK634]TDO16959.1 cytochrome bd-I ubiquinol oxidase subunit 2 apoprotein [Mycobacterium sp. BK086]
MGLQQFWFIIVAVLFLGFFVLEGFDFGVGMVMAWLGRIGKGDAESHRRAVLNTIGPVWDGNEVWLITAGGAMFAAFPHWYATVFSTLYLPLLVILLSMIARIVAIEWRGKIDDPKWRRWCDIGIAIGSWLPAILWGVAFAILVNGLPVGPDKNVVGLSITDVLNPYTLLGGLATCALFLFHGAVFLALKSGGAVRTDAVGLARTLSVPATVLVAAFGLWTQLAHGKPWTWAVLVVAVVAQLAAVAAAWGIREGWAFLATTIVVAAVVTLLFGSLYPNLVPSTIDPAYDLTVFNGSSSPYTLKVMTWAALIFTPIVLIYQGWTYWIFRKRIFAESIPKSVGLPLRHVS